MNKDDIKIAPINIQRKKNCDIVKQALVDMGSVDSDSEDISKFMVIFKGKGGSQIAYMSANLGSVHGGMAFIQEALTSLSINSVRVQIEDMIDEILQNTT